MHRREAVMKKNFFSLAGLLFFFFATSPVYLSLAADEAKPRASGGPIYDVVVVNGKVIDGSGNPWFHADVAVKGGKIVRIGRIDPKSGKKVIDAKGRVVSPGFIDLHTHSDLPLLADGNAESKIHQGVTLDVIGESSTVAPLRGGVLGEYKEEAKRRAGVEVDWTTLEGYFRRLNKKGSSINVASSVSPNRFERSS
jgi:N-acyl-D-amino-acid deacylase